jgi:hypothetical protein
VIVERPYAAAYIRHTARGQHSPAELGCRQAYVLDDKIEAISATHLHRLGTKR